MNMCLLEVVMCEKCRSSHFQSEGGLKIWGLGEGGLKNFRTGGKGYRFGGFTFAGGRPVPHFML